jgi:hypothetical protein
MTAERAHTTPRLVADRLAAMGYRTPAPEDLPERFDRADLDILGTLALTGPVSVREVLRASLRYERPVTDIMNRLTHFGLPTPDMAEELPKLLRRIPRVP